MYQALSDVIISVHKYNSSAGLIMMVCCAFLVLSVAVKRGWICWCGIVVVSCDSSKLQMQKACHGKDSAVNY